MLSWRSPVTVPLLIAHRGASTTAPENTLAAFRRAIEDGSDAIEFDVRLSKDGEVVVIHDSRLERTTDGKGYVRGKTISELTKLSAGNWFANKYINEKIPLLREVFELCNHKVGLNIEIKEHPRHHSRFDIVERCIHLAREHNALFDIMISSFHHRYLKRVKQLEPEIVTGLLHHSITNLRKSPSSLLTANCADIFICSKTSLRKTMIRNVHEHGQRIGVYTVDDTTLFGKIVASGVDIVFTNDVARLRDGTIPQ